jgi:hypothetical protein
MIPGAHHYLIHFFGMRTVATNARCPIEGLLRGQAWVRASRTSGHMQVTRFRIAQLYADAACSRRRLRGSITLYMIAAAQYDDQIHNFAHNNYWLAQDLGYMGGAHDGSI